MCTLRRSRDRRTRRRPAVAALALALGLFFLLLLAPASARRLSREGVSITRGGLSGGRAASGSSSSSSGAARRRLVGPGSAPPSCRSRCGSCSPCKPVHVPVRPGLSAPLEYYPEAWRCSCGNKLFMP
ncbi:EPIDERMAL PATTERNING FACTOR-like protein 5 [Syzygium oleosum]|uniref:EPIDERMAL PATTERNING FACTOR-like protein 5 n=1 Tax=Syzygium oleosum TaxID=219896 RepID=UPI0011D21F55|nr:EPIDERMAL PATTERNING FACTOR-like protein 5 [Syzygium oleosum]